VTDGGLYESWVTALRKWRDDPTFDMSGLQPLAADSFAPATYDRLMAHLNDAIGTMMRSWNTALARAMRNASSTHDLAREFVQLRALLGRRVQLARHPSFPQQISSALWDTACSDIRSIQHDIEKAVTVSVDRASSSRADTERKLEVVRRNSFIAIIEPGYPLDLLFAAPTASVPRTDQAHNPMPEHDAPPAGRRVVFD
jgi:hypothetical protein